MSGDEVWVLLVALAVGGIGWTMRLARALAVSPAHSPRGLRVPLLYGPVASLVVIFFVLRTLASFDVKNDPVYLLFYLMLGWAWTFVGSGSWMGIHAREDVAERGNRAAAVAWNGVVLGAACCYAGANIGDGPGWWCVVWAGGLATVGWTVTWMLVHAISRIGDHVTIDRDLASGIRAASYLTGSGILWGRGAAGDWTSAYVTVLEMAAAWPVGLLIVKAILVERLTKPTPERLQGHWLHHGVLPALLDLPLVYAGLILAGPIPDTYVIPGAP